MKKLRKVLTLVVVFSMMASYSYIPVVQAASLTGVSDTLSTSAPSTLATHTLDFTTSLTIDAGGYIEVDFSDGFGDITSLGDITCPVGGTAATSSSKIARCNFAAELAATTTSIIVTNITNPTSGFADVVISTYANGGGLLESSIVIDAIIDTVLVTAHVDSTLEFTVSGLASGTTVNGASTTVTTTASTTPFGNIDSATRAVAGQQLAVTTNASAGFQVTVTQNDDFQTAAGAIIDSFVDGSATSTPTPWAAPSGDIDDPTTWGHFGITSDDSDNTNGEQVYGSDEFTGIATSTPTVIMGHDGPSSGTAENRGLTNVAYAVQINALQEAGDYETTLTYICTPKY